VVNNEAVAGPSAELLERPQMLQVLGRLLCCETKVNGDTLIANSSMITVILPASSLGKLGLSTDGTGVKLRGSG
jgi:hypothetical protein